MVSHSVMSQCQAKAGVKNTSHHFAMFMRFIRRNSKSWATSLDAFKEDWLFAK